MSSNETKKIQVMNNIVECMKDCNHNITLSNLKKYQYFKDSNEKLTYGEFNKWIKEGYENPSSFERGLLRFHVYINKEKIDFISPTNKAINGKLEIFLGENQINDTETLNKKTFKKIIFEKLKNIILVNTKKDDNKKRDNKKNIVKFLITGDNTSFMEFYIKYYVKIFLDNFSLKNTETQIIYFNTDKNIYILYNEYSLNPRDLPNNYTMKSFLTKINSYIYIDIKKFEKYIYENNQDTGIYIFWKYQDDKYKIIEEIGNKNYNTISKQLSYKDFYILSFNEKAQNYTEDDSNNVINKIFVLNPSVLIICTQESGSGTTMHFQKILQKRLDGSDYKLISHRDESKTIIKLGNKNVRTYFYVNMDKINFGYTIKKKFKTIGKKRLYIFENRNVTEQERNNDNKSIELISYEWKRSKESFGYKYANTIGRVLKRTIYKGAICLKVSLKYNGLEHSFIIVNTNFSNNNRKQDQFDNVCKEFNLENEIVNSTIFFCGDLNFNIDNSRNELNNYIKNHIVLYDDVSDKMKNLYKKFLDCINSIDVKIRLPNRIIYAISDKDKYDVYINKDNFGSIQIKEGSNMSSFKFIFIKNNANKLIKLIEAIPNIRTVQNLKRIANITANINVPKNFEDKYGEVLNKMIQKANKNILPNLNGVKDIFNEMSGENLDEFIFFRNYDIGEIKEYEKTGLNHSEYITNIFINGKKYEKSSEINNLIDRNNNYEKNILKMIFYRSSGGFTIYNLLFKLIKERFNKDYIQTIDENSIYVNKQDNKLFILIKELTYFYLDYTSDFKFPPIYSLLSFILCDIKSKKFYIFIKPIIKFIDFTNYLINGNKANMLLIDTKCNNILSNFKMYHDKIKRDNSKYYSYKYIFKDFYLVSFANSKKYEPNLISTLIEQIQIQNPVFVIVFQKDITKELEKRSYIILNKYSKNGLSTYIYTNKKIEKYNKISVDFEENNNNNFIKLILKITINKQQYQLSFLNCKNLSKDITSSNDTFIIGNLSNKNRNFISKYNEDKSIYKTDTFNEFKDNTELYKIFDNTEYLNSIKTLRIHLENRIVYNNDPNIYINPYDLNFYGNIETLSFRLVRKPYPKNYEEIFNIILDIQSIIKKQSEKLKKIMIKSKETPVNLSNGIINNRIRNYKKEINNIKQIQQKNKLMKFLSLIKLIIKLRYTTKITEKSKDKIDNFIKEINKFVFDVFVDTQKLIDFFKSDIDDVYKFKIGELLYYYNLLDEESKIRNYMYYPY
jgi:hypothetical protein